MFMFILTLRCLALSAQENRMTLNLFKHFCSRQRYCRMQEVRLGMCALCAARSILHLWMLYLLVLAVLITSLQVDSGQIYLLPKRKIEVNYSLAVVEHYCGVAYHEGAAQRNGLKKKEEGFGLKKKEEGFGLKMGSTCSCTRRGVSTNFRKSHPVS